MADVLSPSAWRLRFGPEHERAALYLDKARAEGAVPHYRDAELDAMYVLDDEQLAVLREYEKHRTVPPQ